MLIKKTFSGGIAFKPGEGKTDDLPIETLQPPPAVTIPLLQGAGGPAQPAVKAGDHVSFGQMIGKSCGGTSAAVHASVSGTVSAVEHYPYTEDRSAMCVTLENDNLDEVASPIPYDKPWHDSNPEELLEKVGLSGIIDRNVSLYSRLAPAVEKPVQTLFVNAVQSEPWLSAGSRLFIEQTESVLLGAAICQRITGASLCRIIISDKRPELEKAISELLSDERFKSFSIDLLRAPRYPAQNDRLLVRLCTGKELAAADSIMEAGCVVLSPEAAAALKEAIVDLMPCCRRVVTVAGPMVASPKNLLVRIGTPVRQLLDACSIDVLKIQKLVAGGLLAGEALQELDSPVTKTTAALLAIDNEKSNSAETACIGCRRCYAVCPVRLDPASLAGHIQSAEGADLKKTPVCECIECGCCAWVCPSKINLLHFLKYGKRVVQSPRLENFLIQRPAA